MRGLSLSLTIALAIGATSAAAERPLFETGSEYAERPRQHEVKPNAELVRLVLAARGYGMASDLDPCLVQYHLAARDYGSLMYAVPIRSGPGRTLWFVRGSLQRFCLGLYGAHAFSYFLIDEWAGRLPRYRLVFENAGDYFSIYRTRHHGLNDIQPGGCIATECGEARMVFDGRRYRAIRCTRMTWDDHHHEIRRPRTCDAPW
jgi:hypothetical protein